MADFNVTARNGNMINVPDFAKLNIDGLDIIGDQTTDWNEPIQKNFLAIDKKVMNLENKVLTDVPVGAIFTDTVYSKPVSEPISYIVGLQTELDNKLEVHQDISGKADKTQVLTDVPANALFTDTVYDDTSILDKIEVEKSRIDGILTASTTDADTFAEIVALVNSIDATNDSTLAGYVTANNTRSTAIETSVSDVNNLINYPSATLTALVV